MQNAAKHWNFISLDQEWDGFSKLNPDSDSETNWGVISTVFFKFKLRLYSSLDK